MALQYNVALPPAILSRFDLVHVMVDTPDVTQDYSVAKHIVSVHQSRDAAIHPEFSTLQLQKYIKYARAIKPEVSPSRASTGPFVPPAQAALPSLAAALLQRRKGRQS